MNSETTATEQQVNSKRTTSEQRMNSECTMSGAFITLTLCIATAASNSHLKIRKYIFTLLFKYQYLQVHFLQS